VLNKKKRIIGTRIFGWVSRKLRKKKFLRIIIACGKRLI
jgi:ribosomal protein L14